MGEVPFVISQLALAPKRALKSIACGKLTFDERGIIHRVDRNPEGRASLSTWRSVLGVPRP